MRPRRTTCSTTRAWPTSARPTPPSPAVPTCTPAVPRRPSSSEPSSRALELAPQWLSRATLCAAVSDEVPMRTSGRPGREHPAGGGESNLRAVHVGLEGGADQLHDLGAGALVGRGESLTEGAQARDITVEVGRGEGASHVDGRHVDLGPSAVGQDGADA